jgi:anti-sigma regulatory factor (Ser/Thr protein kinase)
MTRLHFQPIHGKSLDIIDAILQTEEVASIGDNMGIIFETVDELVANIVDYSNSDYLDIEIVRDDNSITLRFRDGGIPFNPLKKDPPDISLPMEEREIGGLGIFLVIKKMDVVEYEHTDGENILTVKKMIKD